MTVSVFSGHTAISPFTMRINPAFASPWDRFEMMSTYRLYFIYFFKRDN